MKYIFDFDDVLFNTKQFKEHIYTTFEKAGVSRDKVEEYYKRNHKRTQSLFKEMLIHFSLEENLYEELLKESKNSTNKELLKIIKNLEKENCHIITRGGKEWQLNKIKRSNIEPFFSEIIVVWESKKEAVEKICAKYKDEEVLFIDDKAENFKDLDFVKYPNLKTILYDEQGLEKFISILPQL